MGSTSHALTSDEAKADEITLAISVLSKGCAKVSCSGHFMFEYLFYSVKLS
jgi:hypothetical protein